MFWIWLVIKTTPLCTAIFTAFAIASIQLSAVTAFTSPEAFTNAYVAACVELGRANANTPEETSTAATIICAEVREKRLEVVIREIN